MTEPSTEWPAVHTAITELAAILAGARAALGGAGRAGNQLEMAEMDLLSARSAVENACWELDFEPPTAGDLSRSVQPARPVRVPDGAEQPDPQRPRRPGRRAPGQGQCELFSLPTTHDERGPAHGTRTDHFRWVLKQARPGSVLLLIDDLDRCPETFVVELLDSVQKLMRDQESTIGQREQRKRQVRVRRIHHVAPSLVVIVAADGRWVRGSYDNTYASMTNAVNEPAATVGSLFLQKLFQLTVPVPRLSEGLKKEYLTGLLADQKGGQIRQPVDPELAKRVSNARPEDVLDEIAAASPLDRVRISEIAIGRLVTEPDAQEHTRHALEEYAELLEPTPRAMKRFVMAYSMLRAVRTAEGSVVDIGPLALWTIVLTRWPTLAEHLQASPAEVHLFKTPPDRLPPSTPHQLLTLFTDPPDDLRRVMNHVNGPMNEGNIRECSGQANRASTKARTTGKPTSRRPG